MGTLLVSFSGTRVAVSIWVLFATTFSTSLSCAEIDFKIPPAAANVGLKEFAEQSQLSVMFEAALLPHFRTRGVEGKYEPIEAIRILLDGSGLDFSLADPSHVYVGPKRMAEPRDKSSDNLPTVHISANATHDLVSLPPGVNVTRIPAADLSAQGFTTLPDWAQTMTQNQGTGAREATSYMREAPTNVGYGSGLNLYGVGQRATLILTNGHRLAPSGSAGSFTDVLNLPISAIDHIDLISAGAATIYGADAAGGIVNFILRDTYSRPVTVASYGIGLAGSDVSQSSSIKGDRWRSVVAFEYYTRAGLPAAKRKQASSDERPWGGNNFDIPFGNPASIIDNNGHYWAIPPSQNGTSLTAADLFPGLNLYDRHADTWILPRQQRFTLFASGSYDIANELTLFADCLLSRRGIETHLPPLTALLAVPNTNPFYVNPIPGSTSPVQILYGFGNDYGPITEHGRVDSGQLTEGFKYELNERWGMEATAGYAFDNQHEVQNNRADIDELTRYLAMSDPSVAFNPFAKGSSNNPATLAAVRTDGGIDYLSELATFNLEASGLVDLLPSGPISLTSGYEFRRQVFQSSVSPGYSFTGQASDMNRRRTLNSFYLQSSMPVSTGKLAYDTSYAFNVSAGVRYERFSDPYSAFLPSVGFSFDLGSGISLTGSWTRMFRPPNLPDLDESLNYAATYPLPDPKSPSGYTTALVWGGNNAHLSPESARNWMVVVRYAPSDPTLSLDLKYFNISAFHQVLTTQLLPISVLSDPHYSYLLRRDVTPSVLADICGRTSFMGSPGQCESSSTSAIVDLRLRALGTVKTDGFDLKSRSVLETSVGQLTLNLQATYLLHFGEALVPGEQIVSFRNAPHNPMALRLRGVLGWEYRGLSISPAINFQGGYTDNMSYPIRSVSSWTTSDLVVGYKLQSLGERIGGNTTISVRALNVFNKQPPFLNNDVGTVGYDPENADLLGRRISLKVEHAW